MDGTMMRYPLTLSSVLERAAALFGKVEIVARRPDRSLHRYYYADFCRRARALAEALHRAGLKRGDRVATLLWNHHIHLECYFGIPYAGGVIHTLNLRLHPDELAFIANHAGDRFLIVDDTLLPLLEAIRDKTRFERIIVAPLCGESLPRDSESYEELLASASGEYSPPQLEENEGTEESPGQLKAELAGRRGGAHLDQLHLGHDRPAEGRRLLAPGSGLALSDPWSYRFIRHQPARRRYAGDVHVPR